MGMGMVVAPVSFAAADDLICFDAVNSRLASWRPDNQNKYDLDVEGMIAGHNSGNDDGTFDNAVTIKIYSVGVLVEYHYLNAISNKADVRLYDMDQATALVSLEESNAASQADYRETWGADPHCNYALAQGDRVIMQCTPHVHSIVTTAIWVMAGIKE